jgi:LysR family transcriptional regulator, transcription activator of glutamate synthase operon
MRPMTGSHVTHALASLVMDTDAIRWFQQVADGMTVTEVSDLEPVTQSGVSRALARLEAEVGAPLLRKSGRTLRMTNAGAAFKRHADALLHELDDGLAAVNQLVDPETGTVVLSFQQSLGTWLVPELIRAFRADHPDVQFELRQVKDDLVRPVLQEGQVDLEISVLRPMDEAVRWRKLVTERLVLAVASDHRFAEQSPIALADVASEPFIALRGTSALRQQCENLCVEAGFQPRIAFEGDDLATVRGFVAAGLGVAIVPAKGYRSSDPETGQLRLLELTDVRAVREIGLSWSVERRLLPAAELFRRHAISTAGRGEHGEPPA